jgi:L-ascorbate metabolism protein UlaG (beta-lactamase superfamily)
MRVEWLGHSSILIDGRLRIYIDPFELEESGHADIVFITHTHADHLDLGSLERIVDGKTAIVCSSDAHSKLAKLEPASIAMMHPGDELEVRGVRVRATPAYNTNKPFHPKENDWLGFVIDVDGLRIYVAGDLDDLPGLSGIACDLLFVPVSGTYVMTADEAARFARRIEYRLAVPVHYGSIVGTANDAERFASLVENAVVPELGVDLLEGLEKR